MTENLVIRDLSVSFSLPEGLHQVVDKVNLICKQGYITGLIGESGSGKSVVGMSILKLLPKNAIVSGQIHFQGQSLLELDDAHIRALRGNEIGFIPQNPATSFDPMKKVGSQILEVLQAQYKNIHGSALSKEKSVDIINEKLSNLGFDSPETIRNSYSFALSGGMCQRALCALGTIFNPSWLIADEPTKGLDTILRKQFFRYFQNLKANGISILLITHDLDLAEHLCDYIGVMHQGRLLEFGETDSIIHKSSCSYTTKLMEARPSVLLERGGL